MKLSVVIPARDEAGRIQPTVRAVVAALRSASIPCEILAVNDGSRDETAALVRQLSAENPEVALVENSGRHGFGMAVRIGLDAISGDAAAS